MYIAVDEGDVGIPQPPRRAFGGLAVETMEQESFGVHPDVPFEKILVLTLRDQVEHIAVPAVHMLLANEPYIVVSRRDVGRGVLLDR
jgi:hypothetical protein